MLNNDIGTAMRRRKKMMNDLETPTNTQQIRERITTRTGVSVGEIIKRKMAERKRGLR